MLHLDAIRVSVLVLVTMTAFAGASPQSCQSAWPPCASWASASQPSSGGGGPLFIDFSPYPDGEAIGRGIMLRQACGVDRNPYYEHSLRLLHDNAFVELGVYLQGSSARAELSLTHLSSASDQAVNGGWSPVNIYVNGTIVADAHSPEEHGFMTETWDISGLLDRGDNTIRIVADALQTHYWLQRVEVGVFGHAPAAHPPRPRNLSIDFSPLPGGRPYEEGISLEAMSGADDNPYYKQSLRLLTPGSYVEMSFDFDGHGRNAELLLRHLSSAAEDATNGGWSPVSISLNGRQVAYEHAPAEHGFMEETWDIGHLLRNGRNVLRIEAGNLETHYWLQRVEILP